MGTQMTLVGWIFHGFSFCEIPPSISFYLRSYQTYSDLIELTGFIMAALIL